uniref:TPR_MLP1_2 domain-containing protein n=1 Tax=Heligmosomoides polygyrus TaxID=6339 RepID=A0A183GGF1_HELPZ
LQAQIALKADEISQLQSIIAQAREARDIAITTADSLRADMLEVESKLASTREERDQLLEKIRADEAEKKMMRESIETQREINEQYHQDLMQQREETDSLIKNLGAKEALIFDLETRLAVTKNTVSSMKEVISEQESKIKDLCAALNEEQERRQKENDAWKADLDAAKETSSALRRDFEKIRSELSGKEENVRYLQDQLRTYEENNVRMAEVICGYESGERKHTHCATIRATTAAEVQTTSPFTKVKSRESQTELTRTALAQLECDAVSYSTELKAFHAAYMELRGAIGELVVKEIEPFPEKVDIPSIQKSCRELSRLIHHERIRREQQANELAEMTAKLGELREKRALEGETGVPSNVSVAMPSGGPSLQQKKYDDPMRQTLFLMTSMAMDLVKKLRSLSSLHSAGRKVDFSEAINLARSLRNELNDRFLIVRTEEGSENKHFVPDLIRMIKILERDNRSLHENVKTWKAEYEALEKRNSEHPELTERIANQLRSIHSVMGEFTRTYGLLKDSSNTVNAKRDGPTQ